MKKLLLGALSFALCYASLSAQIKFKESTHLLANPNAFFSGVAIGVLDMNRDGRDDIVRLNKGNNLSIEYQQNPDMPFLSRPIGNTSDTVEWAVCAADVDADGYPDVLLGGKYKGIRLMKSGNNGTTFNLQTLNAPATFTQGQNFADINNDGYIDAFVCHDDGPSRILLNDGKGNFLYTPNFINLATVPSSDNSGNYGSVWCDIDNDGDQDLYIAKCRQEVTNPTDPRRINQLFWNNGDQTYTQDLDNLSGLRIGAQSWTADFADIDNDGDFDCFITNHDVSSQLLENDGTGRFADITESAGLLNQIGGVAIQGLMRDFDNDGFVDLLVSGSQDYVFKNNGNKTFVLVPTPFDSDNREMESFALGDLNHDGFPDVYAGYAETFNRPSNIPDVLWLNQGNDNHFLALTLHGKQSNPDAIGARITLHTPAGIQIREVRAGESYGIVNSFTQYFGMGQFTKADSVVIRYPSGARQVLHGLDADRFYTATEGGCFMAQPEIQVESPFAVCTGDSLLLSAPPGFSSWRWSTGDTTAQIQVYSGGAYGVTVTRADGCSAVCATTEIRQDPKEFPTIIPPAATQICPGSIVMLTADSPFSAQWSNGESGQTISVDQPGSYSYLVEGACDVFYSDTIQVSHLPVDELSAVGDTVWVDSVATLTATGSMPLWYAAPSDWIALDTGNIFITPPLKQTTAFWVENVNIFDKPDETTGKTYTATGAGFSDNAYNGGLYFDCIEPVRLRSVTVSTDKAGRRRIILVNPLGDTLAAKDVDIPTGISSIDLNFDLPAGKDLLLTTAEWVNMQSLGYGAPRLRRSASGINYPYTIPDYINIYNSTFDNTRYYYFYDWEIDFYETVCVSERIPVVAAVDSFSISTFESDVAALRFFPNPASDHIFLEIESEEDAVLQMFGFDGALRFQASPAAGERRVALPALPSGVYGLRLLNKGKTWVGRLILERG